MALTADERTIAQYQTVVLKNVSRILESIPDFAQDPDEREWSALSGMEQEIYTGGSLDEMRAAARKLQYTPYGMCILNTLKDFIIGQSAHLVSLDDMEALDGVDLFSAQQYWDKWVKANRWDMRSKETITRAMRDGEVFWRWFPSGGKIGPVLRFMEPGEIKAGTGGKPTHGILTDEDDIETVLGYHRIWTDARGTIHEKYIDADEIDHMKILVDSSVKRGISYFVPVAKTVAEYAKWLADRIMLNKIRHLFNIVAEPLNPTASLSGIKEKFEDVSRTAPTDGTRNKKGWKSGTVLATKGVKWDLKALNINAADTVDDGRAIQLLIGIATGFPEYIVRGDASNANYSSTMVAESPFVRMIQSWQDQFSWFFQKAYRRVILNGVAEKAIPSKFERTIVHFDMKTRKDVETKEEATVSAECEVNFDSVIARNLKDETEAVVTHIEAGLCSRRTAANRFGYDYDAEQEQIEREKKAEEEEARRVGMDPSHVNADRDNEDVQDDE